MAKSLFVCLLILIPVWVQAETENAITIRGQVLDTNGNPLPGANIVIEDTPYNNIVDKNGKYVLPLPGTERNREITLKVSFVGYISQSLTLTLAPGTIRQDFRLQRDVLKLGVVEVTAQKRGENLQKVPISISAIDAGTIEQKGAYRLLDLEYAVPNLNFTPSEGERFTGIAIRGISDFSRNIGYESRAGVYIDGVFAGRSVAVNQDLLDIERVEVLRGPQGTLFGKNTVSGAINLITRKPHSRYQGKFTIEAGNYNYLHTRAIVNVPLIQNRLFAKISAKKANRKGFVKNLYNGNDLNGENNFAGRLQLRYLASEPLEFNLSLSGVRDRIQGTNAIGFSGLAFDQAPALWDVNHDADEYRDRDLFTSALSVNYNLPGSYNLSSLTSYNTSEWEDRSEEDYTDLFISFSEFNEQSRHFTQEVRLASPSGQKFNFVTGVYSLYQKAETSPSAVTGSDYVIPGLRVMSSGEVTTWSIAEYFQGNLHLTKNLTLTGGLRYTHENKTRDYSLANTPERVFFIDIDHFTDDYTLNKLSPKGGINLQLSDQMMIYGSVSRGFKSGGWNADLVTTLEQIQFDLETVTSYETGFKFTTPNDRLRLNAAAYVAKFNDYQVFQFQRTSQDQTFLTVMNAGKVTSKGTEVELSILPLSELAITAGLGLTRAKYDEFKNGGGEGIHYDGHKLSYAPEIEYNLAVNYRKRLGQAGTVVLHSDVAYKDDFFTNPNNNRETNFVKAYHLLNARLGFETHDGDWGLSLSIRNVTDKLYMTRKNVSFIGVQRGWLGSPRTFALQLTYNFFK